MKLLVIIVSFSKCVIPPSYDLVFADFTARMFHNMMYITDIYMTVI